MAVYLSLTPVNGAKTYPTPPSSVKHIMPAKTDPREPSTPARYYYRRALSVRELLPAIGVGLAMGVMAFYVTQAFLQRTPLGAQVPPPARRRKRGHPVRPT